MAASASSVVAGGFDAAVGCSDVSCAESSQTLAFDSAPFATTTGFVDVDTVALTMDLVLNVSFLRLSATALTGGDNGIGRIEFTDAVYTASGLSLMSFGQIYMITSGAASIVGTQTQYDTGGAMVSTGAISAPSARVTGSCFDSGSSMTCGLTFGSFNFSLDVGLGTMQERFLRQTADLVAVPEPSTAVMLALGLAGLWSFRRSGV
jgi:hypothetical protein